MDNTLENGPQLPRFAFRDDARLSYTGAIFDVLEAEHARILQMFTAIALYAEGDDERLDLFDQLRRELVAHLRAEEETAYPALAASGTCVIQSMEEHLGFEVALARLAGTPQGERWGWRFAALRSSLVAHMREEQAVHFVSAKQETSLEEQIRLGRAFEESRNRHLKALGAQC